MTDQGCTRDTFIGTHAEGACADPVAVPAVSMMADRRNRIIGLDKGPDPFDMCNDRTADYLGVSDETVAGTKIDQRYLLTKRARQTGDIQGSEIIRC